MCSILSDVCLRIFNEAHARARAHTRNARQSISYRAGLGTRIHGRPGQSASRLYIAYIPYKWTYCKQYVRQMNSKVPANDGGADILSYYMPRVCALCRRRHCKIVHMNVCIMRHWDDVCADAWDSFGMLYWQRKHEDGVVFAILLLK